MASPVAQQVKNSPVMQETGGRWLDRCVIGWTPEVGDGQGGLACCDSWGSKESNMTE